MTIGEARHQSPPDGQPASVQIRELTRSAQQLSEHLSNRRELPRVARLLDRLHATSFSIAVVGEFKRGKSTLINALIAQDVLPTGVVPLTAIETRLVHGDLGVDVEFLDGERRVVPESELPEYVTEASNPRNVRGVAVVTVRGNWSLLEAGVEIVDTPGVGSVHEHNTDTANESLLNADGAIMVLSAGSPLSKQEFDLVHQLTKRQSPTFFVLNKADHLNRAELAEVERFVGHLLEHEFGHSVPLFAVDARSALTAQLENLSQEDVELYQFEDFRAHLRAFVQHDLQRARIRIAATELRAVARSVGESLAIEAAASANDDRRLEELVALFEGEAARQRSAFMDDCTLLARDVASVVQGVEHRVREFASAAPERYRDALAAVASTAPRARLGEELRLEVESSVRHAVDDHRVAETLRIESAWTQLTDAFRDRTSSRVAATRETASRLFDVPLPSVDVPMLADIGEEFTYLFLYLESIAEPVTRALSRLVPSSLARRRAFTKAYTDLRLELDKHAGRTRWDFSQRVDAMRREFEGSMSAVLEDCIDSILAAADRAVDWKHASQKERELALRETSKLAAIVRELSATR